MKLNMKAIIIAGVVVVAMVLEAVVIFMMMPANSPATAAAAEDAEASVETEIPEGPKDDLTEVAIDSFNCTNNVVAPGSVIHLSFKVIGVVPAKLQQSFDENANKTHKTRVRQVIERIARSSSLEDLNDPNLGTIKRLIREETNKTLGRSYVSEVVITEFRMLEQ